MVKTQLHQLLAVEKDRKRRAASILTEATAVFKGKKELFDGFVNKIVSTQDDAPFLENEQKEMVTSVIEKLDYTFKTISDALNLTLSKEETNSKGNAKAELVVDGKNYGSFSATSLLALENNIEQVFLLLKEIPTLDTTSKWVTNPNRDDVKDLEIPEKQYKTQKKSRAIVLYEATKEHPAQVQLQAEDVQIGYWETHKTTGRFTPREKTDILSRVETLLEAVKTSRSKANTAEVEDVTVANDLFKYILGK